MKEDQGIGDGLRWRKARHHRSGDRLLRLVLAAQGVQHDLDEVTRYADVRVGGSGILRDQAAGQSLGLVETSADAEHVALHGDGAVVMAAAGVLADLERALDGCGGGRAVLTVKSRAAPARCNHRLACRCSGSGLGGSLRHT